MMDLFTFEDCFENKMFANNQETKDFQDPWLTDDKTELLYDLSMMPEEDESVPEYISEYQDRMDYLFFKRIGDTQTLSEMEEKHRVERLRGGGSEDEESSSDNDEDESGFNIPRSLSEIEIPVPGQRPSAISTLTSSNNELLKQAMTLSYKLGENPSSWQEICHDRIKHIVTAAHKKYRSHEKQIFVELSLTNTWLREWIRILKLRYDTQASKTFDAMIQTTESKDCTRHLDIDCHAMKHAFRGAQTFRDIMITLFSTEPDEVLVAKLGLLATSEDACLRYSRSSIFKSFLKICRAASITGDELIQFTLKIIPNLRLMKTSALCICGQPIQTPSQWKIHGCRFERWMIASQIGVTMNQFLKIKSVIDWKEISEIEDQNLIGEDFLPTLSRSSTSESINFKSPQPTTLETMKRIHSPCKQKKTPTKQVSNLQPKENM